MEKRSPDDTRLYLLDALRGFAALSIVFWHWQHFFFFGTSQAPFQEQRQPLFDIFGLLYSQGAIAVDLFFQLSGFIFAWLYAAEISRQRISAYKFFVYRFARLYPLHLATLLLLLWLQAVYFRAVGSYFVISDNDDYHFLLQLFFASSWGLERGFSFNGPSWSISVEVLLYALFFVVCRALGLKAWLWISLFIVGLFIGKYLYSPLGRGISCFFLGGCLYLIYRRVSTSRLRIVITRLLALVLLLAWAWTVFAFSMEWDEAFVNTRLKPGFLNQAHWEWLVHKAFSAWSLFFLLPGSILTLAVLEPLTSVGKRFAFLGDISYSVYLIHFPLQLAIILGVDALGLGRDMFYSLGWFVAFFTGLLAISFASYRLYELPMQNVLRRRLYDKRLFAGAGSRSTSVDT